MGNVLRVAVNGVVINLAKEERTISDIVAERVHMYHSPGNVRMMARGRSGKVKVYTPEEIAVYAAEGG